MDLIKGFCFFAVATIKESVLIALGCVVFFSCCAAVLTLLAGGSAFLAAQWTASIGGALYLVFVGGMTIKIMHDVD